MSSEGSVSTGSSSRIRQFGLYRSVDARTEEFLRLSRKRQLKQGCACAAISTAITVTVVITVFFVYMEYGMSIDANQPSIGKAGWIGLLNDTLASSFEEKFSKSKINFDRNTIKLLPILLKALKQNRYLEKILEDTSSSPAYDGKITTEFSFKKDIFLNTKNWFKKPTSKLYTIEYKTSPIILLKKPTRETEYFTKNRKTREYKRIMAYVEKMINDKVGVGYSMPMTNQKLEAQNEILKTLHKVPPKPLKANFNKKYRGTSKQSQVLKPKQDEVVSCKCPKQLGIILDKIFSSIQLLLPDDKVNKSLPCHVERNSELMDANSAITLNKLKLKIATTTVRSDAHKNNQKTPLQFSEFDNIYKKEETTTPTQSRPQKYINNMKQWNTNELINDDSSSADFFQAQAQSVPVQDNKHAMNINTIKPSTPSIWSSRLFHHNFDDQTTLTYDQIKPTEGQHNISATTQPMPPTIDILEKDMERDQIDNPALIEVNSKFAPEIEEINIFQSNYLNKTSENYFENMNTNLQTFKLDKALQFEKKCTDNVTTTTDSVLFEMNKLDIPSFELLKSKLLPSDKRLNFTDSPNSAIELKQSTTESNMMKSATTFSGETDVKDITSTTTTTTTEAEDITSGTAESSTEGSSTLPPIILSLKGLGFTRNNTNNEEKKAIYNITGSDIRKKVIPTLNITDYNTEKAILDQLKNKQEPFYLGLDNIAFEEEIEKMTRNDDLQDLNLKQTENGSANTKNSTAKLQDFWQSFYSNERIYSPSSMLPHNRPTYLEIHRNADDWKPEENKDYDTDMKYNIFDLL